MKKQRTILVVDDTLESLRVVTEMLKPEGYQIRPANNGQLALDSIAIDLPDLILLDLRMPGIDGFEICRRLKGNKATESIPIIFLSAATELVDRLEGLKLGAVDFISKPCQREELLARVKTHLDLAFLRGNLEELVKERTSLLEKEITERKRAEEEQRKLQLKLNQSQKMESIGRLAGGVAHDFNNMLSIILGYTQLLLRKVPVDSEIGQSLKAIESAAERSGSITRQLLAFSRKEIIDPKPVNLNAQISDMENSLGRLIGEDISLSFNLSDDLWPVLMDPSQLDQVLMNLSVNARDSMPNGGPLNIETANIHVSNDDMSHPGVEPGDYVLLKVSDGGHGMDRETREHIFEPFFTTKNVGEGSGLGLATVYGIVTQNNGFINVSSAPGQGTVFTIYLPRLTQEIIVEKAVKPTPITGSGTILLVEDEETLLLMATALLEEIGYTVIQVATPQAAIATCEKSGREIDMILTDVVMPGMNGREMVDQIRAIRPEMKVLFMSGYTSNIVAQRSVLEEGMYYIQKPFSVTKLNEKIQQVLSVGKI